MAIINGNGSVNLQYISLLGNLLSFQATITMPCDFDQSEPFYEMNLLLCNEDGVFECLLFRIDFPECETECGKEQIEGRFLLSDNNNSIQIYPNPAQNEVMISTNNVVSKQHNVIIYNHLGKSIQHQSFSADTRLDVRSLQTGIYYVKVNDGKGNLIGIEKMLILK